MGQILELKIMIENKRLTEEDLQKMVEDRLKGLMRCSCTCRIFQFWKYVGCCPGQIPVGIILYDALYFKDKFTNGFLEIVV